jgi:hypothetical protein
VDVFEPGSGSEPTQLHDLNPSPTTPKGLFWTVAVPSAAISADPQQGSATYQLGNVDVLDHGTIMAALGGGGPAPLPATVSFKVVWGGVQERRRVRNEDDGHAGDFAFGAAQMEWTATAGDYSFKSAPLASSTSSFAVLGQERNGIYFP